jgi:gliding motility-associated-like protein
MACCLGIAYSSFATHIVGGELYYKYLGNDNYEIYFDYYIDCINGNAGAISSDRSAWFGVFEGKTNKRIASLDRRITRTNPVRVSDVNYKCIITKPNACVDKYQYKFTLKLPPKDGGYIIVYQRCCRNNTITNLSNPGGQGSTYFTKIEDTETRKNNAAAFKNLPPNFLCTNAPLVFDHSATDVDGDSLVYELYKPFNSFQGNLGANNTTRPQPVPSQFLPPPFVPITWANGYNDNLQINATSPIIINSKTGQLNFTPTQVGQFVVGISVKEYRDGELINTTRRDFQFNVSNCEFEVVSSFFAPSKSCDFRVTFNNNSRGNGALTYNWDFGETEDNTDKSTSTFPSYKYKQPGTYEIQLIAGNINCADTYTKEVRIVDPVFPNLGPDDTLCNPFTRIIDGGLSTQAIIWNTGTIGSQISVNQPGNYIATYQKEGCSYKDTITIVEDNDRPVLPVDSVICENVPFEINLSVGNQYKSINWSTGESSTQITVNQPNVYAVQVTTMNDCVFEDTMNIVHKELPMVNINDTNICPLTNGFFEVGTPNLSYQWSTGSTDQRITVNQPGKYSVKAFDGKCYNEDSAILDIIDIGPYGLPKDTVFCDKVFMVLNPGNQFKSYNWSTGEKTPIITALNEGTYAVILTSQEGCVVSDSITLGRNPLPNVGLGPDTIVCQAIHPVLDAGPGVVYLWQDGSNLRTLTAFETGIYHVEVTDQNGCINSDTVEVTKNPNAYPSNLYMPNAFTPNGDGINEIYPDNQFKDIGVFYNLKIFNRWGEKLADFDSPDGNWDGTYKGQKQEEGVYIYLVSWIGCDNTRRSKQGNITLLK